MDAVILAAGLGSRLKEYTENQTKSMVEVNGITIIERLLRQLEGKVNSITVVLGYRADELEKYIDSLELVTPINYIINTIYDSTNNIYSLYKAKEVMIKSDTILFESDLMFSDDLIKKMLSSSFDNFAVISKFETWMDGTVVSIDSDNNIYQFISGKEFEYTLSESYYKTVNIYKFSKDFSKNTYFPFLEAHMKAFGRNAYYEAVLQTIVNIDKTILKGLDVKDTTWYEVDDLQDLDIASTLFNINEEDKFDLIQSRYGGFWRYPSLVDFCYLVNPFYPPKRMLDEISNNIERLVIDYPSGIKVNSLLVSKYYGVPSEYTVVGNGAAELIKSYMDLYDGKYGVIAPTFEEYSNRVKKEDIIKYYPKNELFKYTVTDIIDYFEDKKINHLILINPDNPTGNFIEKKEIVRLVEWCKEKDIRLVLDESFGDFVNSEKENSLINKKVLLDYPNLVIIKSISKSFGVPGVRLGFLMSSDVSIITKIQKDVSIWNINSFGEFFLQIFEKYKKEYTNALEKFYLSRSDYYQLLKTIPNIEVIPSQANYFTCYIKPDGKITSRELAIKVLKEDNLLIKDLSNKDGFNGANYIRIAVKRPEENIRLVNVLKKYLGG